MGVRHRGKPVQASAAINRVEENHFLYRYCLESRFRLILVIY